MRKALISQGFSVRHLLRPQYLVGDGGFDLHFLLLLQKKIYVATSFLNWCQQVSTGHLHLNGFESYHPHTKRKSTPNGVLFFLAFLNLIYIFR